MRDYVNTREESVLFVPLKKGLATVEKEGRDCDIYLPLLPLLITRHLVWPQVFAVLPEARAGRSYLCNAILMSRA